MAVTTKKSFAATSNATTTVFSPVSIQLNNQDDLDVYVTLSGGTRVLQLRQSTGSTAQSSHPQVNNTDGLYFPAVSAGTTLYNYQLSTDNNTITFNSALPSGAVVFCERRTRDADSSYTSFASGSTIRATDLNNSSTESNFTAQDGRNKALTMEGVLFRGDQPSTNFVTTDHIVAGTIVRGDIANDAVNGDKIADDSIDSEHYVDGSIDTQHIGADQITGALIADDTINSEHYAAGSIDLEHMSANSVDSDQYVDGSVDRVHLEADIIDSTKLADDAVGVEHIQSNAITDAEIAIGTLDGRYYTETELNAGQLDNRYYTETESEALFLRQDSSETIASGVTWSGTDSKVATTAAIDLRIIDLIDDVGGFVPIANETSFPTANPDVNNGTGTIVSVKAASTNLAPSGTTVTIANGAGTGNTVTVTGVSATIPSGFGFLVETTTTLHTYTFHRLVPKATEVSTVAANAVNIAAAGANVVNIDSFADRYQISTSAPTTRADGSGLTAGDLWFDSSSNKVMMVYDASSGDGFSNITPNQSDLTNINIVAGQITFQEDLGLITNAVNTGSGNNSVNTVGAAIANVNLVGGSIANVNNVGPSIANVNTVAGSIANVNTVSGSIANVNTFANTYFISANAPGSPSNGDLWYDSTNNVLKNYNGSAWLGITSNSGIASVADDSTPQLGGALDGQNNNMSNIGTIDGTNLQLDFGTIA